ncbi:MAG: hypothetical protein OCD02_13595 [Spirochaetaceae bacterium]
MIKSFYLLLFIFPSIIWAGDFDVSGLLQIDVKIKIVDSDANELWSVDLTKYTISNRSISISLNGYDGNLTATLNPIVMDKKNILLQTSCIVTSLETEDIIQSSSKEIVTSFNKDILFFPLGDTDVNPKVIMELKLIKHNGDDV